MIWWIRPCKPYIFWMHLILADHPDPLTSDHPTHPNHLTTLTVTTMTTLTTMATPTHHPDHFDQPTRPDPEQQFAKFAKKCEQNDNLQKSCKEKIFFNNVTTICKKKSRRRQCSKNCKNYIFLEYNHYIIRARYHHLFDWGLWQHMKQVLLREALKKWYF